MSSEQAGATGAGGPLQPAVGRPASESQAETFYRGSGHGPRGQRPPVDRRPGAADRLPPDPRSRTWRARRTALLWSTVWEIARRLPESIAFGLADLGGRLGHLRGGRTRARVRANLSRVVPADALDRTVRDAYRSYARYWVEAFRAADMDVTRLDARTTTDGFRHLDGVLDAGRGAIVLLAHHGSWDVAARWAESHGYHLAVVAEVLRPRQLFARFVRLRESIGLEVVPLARRAGGDVTSQSGSTSAGQASIVERLAQVLDDNHLVGLLTDRDVAGRAPRVALFGEPVPIPLGASSLSARTGTPIVPITLLQRPRRRWHLQILPPIHPAGREPQDIQRDVAGALEELIRLAPAQWHAFQPVFDPPTPS